MARLFVPYKDGTRAWFRKRQRPGVKGWIIDDIVWVLGYLVSNYESVGGRKPEFTRAEVGRLVDWVLHKKKFIHEGLEGESDAEKKNTIKTPRGFRAATFVYHLLDTIGNAAEAARRAGYSSKRAKQTAYDLMRPRTRF